MIEVRKILTFGRAIVERDDDYQQADEQGADDNTTAGQERAALGPGDELAYAIEGERVILTKSTRTPADDPFATFGEWSSEADRQGYAGL